MEIPNGVNFDDLTTPVARPEELDPRVRGGEYMLFLGRLHACKGVDVLLEAQARLRIATETMFVVAGDGQERQALAMQAQRLGIAHRVCFAGAVSGTTKTWLLQNALGVVIPSRRWEAFPLVVLESYAAGKPVIGTDIAGLQDLIHPGVTGSLVPADSPAELARAMEGLLADRAERERLGAGARQIAEAYRWPSVAARHLELFKQLKTSPPPRALVLESRRLAPIQTKSNQSSTLSPTL